MRYVIVAFFFLGLAFYEMSGGADFDPEATRLARIEAPAVTEQETLETVLVETEPTLPESVTRVALNLNSVQDVVRPARRLPKERARNSEALDTPRVPLSEEPPAEFLPSLIGENAIDTDNLIDTSVISSVDFSGDKPAPLPVLATPEPKAPEAVTDIRSVTGEAVNMRGGPGLNHSVVNRLVFGDEVEVLKDPGEGWVQLRPLNGSQIGWMADFLLTEG